MTETETKRYIVEGDRLFDTDLGVYYIREKVAVENLNRKLERACELVMNTADRITVPTIRALRENV